VRRGRSVCASHARRFSSGRHRRSAGASETMKTHDAARAAVIVLVLSAAPALAQDPAPRIGPFALDLHATVPQFPNEDAQLAASRGMQVAELPGNGLGVQASAHLYLLKVKVVTVGIGAEFAASRARKTPDAAAA